MEAGFSLFQIMQDHPLDNRKGFNVLEVAQTDSSKQEKIINDGQFNFLTILTDIEKGREVSAGDKPARSNDTPESEIEIISDLFELLTGEQINVSCEFMNDPSVYSGEEMELLSLQDLKGLMDLVTKLIPDFGEKITELMNQSTEGGLVVENILKGLLLNRLRTNVETRKEEAGTINNTQKEETGKRRFLLNTGNIGGEQRTPEIKPGDLPGNGIRVKEGGNSAEDVTRHPFEKIMDENTEPNNYRNTLTGKTIQTGKGVSTAEQMSGQFGNNTPGGLAANSGPIEHEAGNTRNFPDPETGRIEKIPESSVENKNMNFSFQNDQGKEENQPEVSQNEPKIKTGDAASFLREIEAHPKTSRTEIFTQIVDKAVLSIKNRRSEMRINLKPEFLGQVQLRISTENQQISVRVLTETPFVKEIIEDNIGQLKTELQNSGLLVEKLDVSVYDDSNQKHGPNENSDLFKFTDRPDKERERKETENDPEEKDVKAAENQGEETDTGEIDFFA